MWKSKIGVRKSEFFDICYCEYGSSDRKIVSWSKLGV